MNKQEQFTYVTGNAPLDQLVAFKEPITRIDWVSKTVDCYGGASGYTENNPCWVEHAFIDNDWIFHLSEKNWATPHLIACQAEAMRLVKQAQS